MLMPTISTARRHVLWAFIICLVFSATVVFGLAKRVEDVREIPTAATIDGWHFYRLGACASR
jgi:hypothetical protein